jgi:hypothetical protein
MNRIVMISSLQMLRVSNCLDKVEPPSRFSLRRHIRTGMIQVRNVKLKSANLAGILPVLKVYYFSFHARSLNYQQLSGLYQNKAAKNRLKTPDLALAAQIHAVSHEQMSTNQFPDRNCFKIAHQHQNDRLPFVVGRVRQFPPRKEKLSAYRSRSSRRASNRPAPLTVA